MHVISEELARLRHCELMKEARRERLAAQVQRVSQAAPVRFRRPAARRG